MRGFKFGKASGFALVVAALLLSSACSNTEEVVEEIFETPVAVAEVFTGSLSGSNRLTGVAKASSDMTVLPKSAGQIIEVVVARGDHVEAGQILARLENKDQQLALEAEKSGLRQAQNGLERAQNGLTQAKNNSEQARSNLQQAESGLAESEQGHTATLKNLEIELKNVERQVETAALNLERMEILYEEGLISLQQLEEVQNGFNAAEDGLERMKLQLEQEEKGFMVERAEGQIEQAQINFKSAEGGIRDAEISVSDAQVAVEQRRISVELAEKRLSETVIRAPVAGQISELDFEVGEFVSNQTSFARLISDDYIDIEISLSAEQLIMVEVDDKVEVEFSSVSTPVEGTVTYIALAANQSGLFKMEVQVDNKDKQFRAGMIAAINIEEVLVADSMIVPTTAVIERQGIAYIFIVNEDKAIQKDVEVIRYDTDYTAISGEVNEGDNVVVKGQNLLSDGDIVRIIKEEK